MTLKLKLIPWSVAQSYTRPLGDLKPYNLEPCRVNSIPCSVILLPVLMAMVSMQTDFPGKFKDPVATWSRFSIIRTKRCMTRRTGGKETKGEKERNDKWRCSPCVSEHLISPKLTMYLKTNKQKNTFKHLLGLCPAHFTYCPGMFSVALTVHILNNFEWF